MLIISQQRAMSSVFYRARLLVTPHLRVQVKQYYLIILAVLFHAAALAQGGPQGPLQSILLNAGIHNIYAEVARTHQERVTGMMFRKEMSNNAGMLFVFERPEVQCFWMRNTLLPLSIAFLTDDGTVVEIAEMKPQSLDSHCSAKPVRFALEMNRGWFAKRGIKVGARLQGAPFRD